MELFYYQSASKWVEALPLGNGRLGAMVFGGTAQERLALNEDTLWSGHPGNRIIPGSFEHIRRAQELVLAGKSWEAEEELREYVLGEFTESYEPLGDLMLDFPKLQGVEIQDYLRKLDIETGVAETSFTAQGVHYTRTAFVSFPRQMLCVRMTASEPVLALEAGLTSLLRYETRAAGCELMMNTRCPSRTQPGYHDRGPNAITYDDSPECQGISAATAAQVLTDGSVFARDGKLHVEGASWAEVRLCCRSNFEGFDRYPGKSAIDPEELARQDLENAQALDFAAMKNEHTADFAALMNRQAIVVEGESHEELPTDERLRRYSEGGEDASLPILLYQFGRYLLVSGSRPGSRALNLQGIWNDLMQPPWSSNYTTNINTEMNYWPAEICNIPGAHEPLFDLMDTLSITGGEVARETFHARGAVTNHNTDIWGLATPVGAHTQGSAVYGWWPLAYAWLSGHLFEHYIYTRDDAFLRTRALPVLRGAAQFLLDTVTEDDEGYLTLRPATSPEHKYMLDGRRTSVAKAATMTDEIIRETMKNYLCALELLGMDEPDREAAQKLLDRLPPLRIGESGRLMEWDQEFEETEPQHRHLSPLCGLFPGHLITVDSDPKVLDAIRAMLERRGDAGTGWSLGWKVNIWARLHDGDHALKLLRMQLHLVNPENGVRPRTGGSYANLFCAHPPFQIDGNFAAASGVPRLLIDSALDEITLLGALPGAWKNVSARGLAGANGCTVDLRVENGRLTELKVRAGCDAKTVVRYGEKRLEVQLKAGDTLVNPPELMDE